MIIYKYFRFSTYLNENHKNIFTKSLKISQGPALEKERMDAYKLKA